jgi:hypothetical protein
MASPKKRAPQAQPALDAATGTVALDHWDIRLGPAFTRSDFLASPLARESKHLVANEPWHTFALPDCSIDGKTFRLMIVYDGEAIAMLIMMLLDPRFGDGTRDWSEQKERARHAAHRQWLAKYLKGAPTAPNGEKRFPWGTVSAGYDPRNEESAIVINYRPERWQ